MRTNKNKVLIIVLVVIAILAIAGGVFAYLYLKTDLFRTGQELFAKYLTQDIDEISQTLSFNKLKEVETKLEQNKYEENITLSYIEEGETEPLGKFSLDTQNDPIDKKYYGIISLDSAEGEETLKLEYMKENDIYALRFTNAVKQFLSVQNGDLKELAKKLGIDEGYIEQIPDVINFEEEAPNLEKLKFTEEEKDAEIKKYSELLYNNIAKEKYTKTKNIVITVNGKTITTNAYALNLNKNALKDILLKVLETLKQDEVILAKIQLVDEMIQEYSEDILEQSLKDSFIELVQEMIDTLKEETDESTEEENIVITVYEEKGKTVRVKLEQGLDYITLDTTEAENKRQIDLNFTSIDEDNTQISNGISFIKENDNKLNIKVNSVEGEEQSSNEVEISLVENGNNIEIDVIIYDEEGKTEFTRYITIVEEIEYKETLDNTNNIIINDLSAEQISSIFTLVGDKLNTEYVKQFNEGHLAPFKLVVEPFASYIVILMAQQSIESAEDELEGAEIHTFNMKFLAYEGNEVSSTEVNALLNKVFAHNIEEANQLTERYVTVSGDVTLDVEDTEVTKIEENKFYMVECILENGIVNEIVITEKN